MSPAKTSRTKAVKKSPARKKRTRPAPSSILQPHADNLRQAVHDALAKAGIRGLSLQSIRFAALPECPAGQHAEQTCTRDADGTEICTWNCVPN